MHPRHHLNQIAASQHGLITFDQARKAGLSTGQVRHKARSGEWSIVRPCVYAVAGAPVTWIQTVAAAAFSLQPRAWVSHVTAARLWGFPGVGSDEVHVLVDDDRRVRPAGVRSHGSQALFSADLTAQARNSAHQPGTDPG